MSRVVINGVYLGYNPLIRSPLIRSLPSRDIQVAIRPFEKRVTFSLTHHRLKRSGIESPGMVFFPKQKSSRWWFQTFYIFNPTWGQ